jgi:hypothetical protein
VSSGNADILTSAFLRVIDPDLTIGNASSVLRLLKHPCRVANSAFEQPQVCFGVGFARQKASVVFELFSAIDDLDAASLADELIMRAFIDILEASPSADVIDQNVLKVRVS